MMNGDYCVYKHTTPSGKVYVGITSTNPLKRWKNGYGYMNNDHFWKAIVKYGWDNIRHEIICTGLSKEEACQKEIQLIYFYQSNNPSFGYNGSIGGDYNNNFGPQNGENNGFYGHHHSEEAKRKISESQYHPVLQYNKVGNLIAEYANPYQAQRQTGILHIQEVCKGIRKSVGGYVWKYKELELKERQIENSEF